MKVRIGSTWLASGVAFESTSGLRINGQQITQEVEFFRAAARAYYPRGNRANAVSFSVDRSHASLRESEVFVLTHLNDLPNSGDVYFYCGTPADQQIVTLHGAILQGVDDGAIVGTSSRITYTLRGGIFRTDITPGPDPDMSNIRRAEVALTAGDTEKAVVFGTPMPGTPIVTAIMSVPDGGDNFIVTLKESSRSSSGFTVYFSGPISGAGYSLSYIAIS